MKKNPRMNHFEKLMDHYLLTTAEIFYHFPDHPLLLQTYVWQDLDKAPDFPVLMHFLHFWEKSIEGKLHSVSIINAEHLCSNDIIYSPIDLELPLHLPKTPLM